MAIEVKMIEKLLHRAYASALASHTHGRHKFIAGPLPADLEHILMHGVISAPCSWKLLAFNTNVHY